MIKWRINLAVRQSKTMPPPRRLIMFALSDVADPKTGVIPDDRTPCLRELAEWTGLDKSTVTRHLDALDADGWVIRDRPDRDTARRDQVKTKYRLALPRGAEDTTEDADSVVHSATQRDAESDTVRGAQDTTTVVQSATTPVVHSAPVPYTDEVTNDKTSSTSENASKPSRSSKPKSPPDRPDVERLCEHLADRIEANGSKRPTIGAKWRDAARLLLDTDKRTEEQVHRAIDWCQDNDFWRSNIKSMPKLREQYDTLRLQAMRPNGRASPSRQLVEHNGLMLKPETVAQLELGKRFEAMDRQNAIEGPR